MKLERARAEELRRIRLLAGVPTADLRRVSMSVREEWFNRGDIVIREGDPLGPVHMIVSGRAEVFVGTRMRRILGPGDSFGELSVFDRGERSATVRAVTQLRTLAMPSWRFAALLDESPEVARNARSALARFVRQLEVS